jgi:N-acetylmuramoyl-L-alanine amidase
VKSSKNKFTIQHPPQVYENDIYLAVSDVIPFFAYAFNLQVQTGTTAQPAPPVSMPASGGKIIVVLDPGHGGTDSGASGQGPVSEKAIALSIAKRVGELIAPSCQAAQTRTKDEALSSVERVSKANVGLNGDLLVSIHTGASQSNTASGFQVFCPMGDADPNVQRSLAAARSISNGLSQATGIPSRGVRQAPCRIFTNLQKPGVLVEVGFITNPKEEALLANAEYQEKLAQGIANGLIAYLGGKAQ